ncbi:MAG TPA: helix-turn-helix transcriptional regulator [Streptosporangiaceae bacterium]|jgi:transcriptional regulator with XRE-family HTH domain
MTATLNGSVGSLFRDELRRARQQAGLTQDQLADRIGYSPSLVAAIETGRRSPTPDFARRSDEALAAAGLLARIQQRVNDDASPSWFREWAALEGEATGLRWWQPTLIPGLLQTPEYARAVLRVGPGITEEEAEGRVSARMERQRILDRDDPPMFFALLDEGALRREVSTPEVMVAQMEHLLEVGERPNVILQVVPLSAGAHPGLAGPLGIASFKGSADVAYLDTALTGQLVEQPDHVCELALLFDTLRGQALPCRASADLIREVMATWT